MEITFERIVALFFNKLKYILVLSLVAAVVSFVYFNNFVDKKYTSSSSLLIKMNIEVGQNTNTELAVTKNLVENYIVTINTANFFNVVADKLNEQYGTEYTYLTLKNNTSISANMDTSYNSKINISYTCGNPESANLVLSTIVSEAISYIDKMNFPNKLIVIDDPTMPHSHSYPNINNNTIYAFIIVFILTACVFFFIEIFDDRIKSVNDITKQYKVNVIGIIPDYSPNKPVKSKSYAYHSYDKTR